MAKSSQFRICTWLVVENPRGGAVTRLKKYVIRSAKRFAYLIGCSLLSMIPVLGRFLWPIVTGLYCQRLLGKRATLILALTWVVYPSLAVALSYQPLRFLSGLRAFSRELMEPYLCRSSMTSVQQRQWFSLNELKLYGFGFMIFLLSRMPVIGPLMFILAQTSIVVLFLSIVEVIDIETFSN